MSPGRVRAGLRAAAAALALPASLAAAEAARPNILLICADDLACNAVGAYGSALHRTPAIDRLAAEGVRFDRFYAGSALCAPARATILTGLHSHRHGVVDNRRAFDSAQPTFPLLLREAGYQTAVVGKWHLVSEPAGFDYHEVLPGQGAYYNPDFLRMGEEVRYEGYVTDVITDRALAWLDAARDPARPFLLMVHYKAPYRDWQPNLPHLRLYETSNVPEPSNLFDDYATRATPLRRQELTVARHLTPRDLKLLPPGRLTPAQREAWDAAYGPANQAFHAAAPVGDALVRWKYQRFVKDYLRCVASIDESVARLLARLEEAGLAAGTAVVLTSDQGFFLGEHGLFDKRFIYEESSRTPLVVRWPGAAPPGRVCGELAQNIDLAPTFLEMAGLRPLPGMHGASLVPLLCGGGVPQNWRKSLYYQYRERGEFGVPPHEGVVTKRYKLIRFPLSREWEFYDLAADPREMTNRYADPACDDAVQALTALLGRLRVLYDVPEEAAE
jgi:arylsulfatase A-like enzyme